MRTRRCALPGENAVTSNRGDAHCLTSLTKRHTTFDASSYILSPVVMAPELNTSSPDDGTILVTWSPVDNAVLYVLCIIQQGSSTRLKVNTTDHTMTFGDLEAGTTYCIKGEARDSEGRAGDDLTVCQITRER